MSIRQPNGTRIAATAGHTRVAMAVGDSITLGAADNVGGYRLPLFRANPALNLVGREWSFGYHEGWSGFTIAQISNQVLPIVDNFAPSLILLIAGTNDLNTGGTAAATYSALITLAQNLKAKASVQFVEIGTIPFLNSAPAAQAAYNSLILGTPNPAPGVFTNDISSSLVFPGDYSDSLHPNEVGYGKMASAWSPVVAALL